MFAYFPIFDTEYLQNMQNTQKTYLILGYALISHFLTLKYVDIMNLKILKRN